MRAALGKIDADIYVMADADIYCVSGFGSGADWYQNLLANPEVAMLVQGQRLSARAEVVRDPQRIADDLAERIRRHPRMMRAMLRLEGLGSQYTHADLLRIAESKALVILHPIAKESHS